MCIRDRPEKDGHYGYAKLREPEEGFANLQTTRDIVDSFEEFKGMEIHITEFNTSYIPNCPLHDTNRNAAYIARQLSRLGDVNESYSYWTFGDIFEELGVPFTPFHGGFGLVANGGIPKPTFWTCLLYTSMPQAETMEALKKEAQEKFGDRAEEFLSLIKAEDGLKAAKENCLVNSVEMGIRRMCEVRRAAGAVQPCYVYEFGPEIPGWDQPGAFHSSDLWFFFETLAKCWRPFTGKPVSYTHLDVYKRQQSHMTMQTPSLEEYEKAVSVFGALGLQVQVTELDIHNPDPSRPSMEALAARYREVFTILTRAKKEGLADITGVTFWGIDVYKRQFLYHP